MNTSSGPENLSTAAENLKLFISGRDVLSEIIEEGQKLNHVRKRFEEIIQVQNLCFLIGSGCSKDVGVPMMRDLAVIINTELAPNSVYSQLVEKYLNGRKTIQGEDIETFLGYLYGLLATAYGKNGSRVVDDISIGKEKFSIDDIQSVINAIKKVIFTECLKVDTKKLSAHETFLKKILSRDPSQSLERVKIFTTNYDLAFEHSFDKLGIHYFNGFTGFIRRVFTPSVFEVDLHYRKSNKNVVDRFDKVVDFVKLHGSINWRSTPVSEANIYAVEEVSSALQPDSRDNVMIYPTPRKVGNSLDLPYSELFRHFYSSIVKKETTLIVLGYGFSDQHINEIITHALTIPSFRLVVVGNPDLSMNAVKFSNVKDPRIWHFSDASSTDKKHYFKGFVEDILPNIEEEKISRTVADTVRTFVPPKKEDD